MSAAPVVFFVSDLHLSPDTVETTAAFYRFLANLPPSTHRLYLLGDLLEFWAGDDMLATPFYADFAAHLAALKKRGIEVFWIHGNRDFLVRKRFLAAIQAVLLPDPYLLNYAGQRLLLSHGDRYCLSDKAYMKYRRVARNPLVQGLFLSLPFRYRLKFAKSLRQKKQPASPRYLGDVDAPTVAALCKARGAVVMVHGHTHRPAVHQHDGITRHVLPDWDFDGSVPRGYALALDESGSLSPFPLS